MSLSTLLERGLGQRTRGVGETTSIIMAAEDKGDYISRPSYTSDLLAAYRVHSWTYAGIRAIGRAVARVPIVAIEFKRTPKFSSVREFKETTQINNWAEAFEAWLKFERATVVDHEILDLIEHPLDEAQLTRYDLIYVTSVYIDLAGDAYWEKRFSNKAKTKVDGLWPKIDPRYMYAIPDEKTLIGGWLYRIGTRAVVFDKDEIVHFVEFNPENPYYGLSPTKVLRTQLIADARAMDWNRAFFDNSAEVPGYLKVDRKINPSDARMLKAMWDEQHKGVARSHGIAVLGQGAEYKKVGLSHTEMGFRELRLLTREEVLAVLGVPPIVAGVSREQGLNRAVAQVQEQLFYENTVLPRCEMIERKMNFGLPLGGERVKVAFDVTGIPALQEDQQTKARIGRFLQQQGWTLQELRTKYWNLPEAEGGLVNDVLIPINLQSAGTVAPAKGVRRVRGKILDVTKLASDPDTLLPDPYESLVDQRKTHAEHLPILMDEGADRGHRLALELGIEVPDDWRGRYNWQQHIDQYVNERLGEKIGGKGIVTSINEETRTRVRRLIRDAMREGEGVPEIAKRLREAFDGMSKTRAKTIAGTELHNALETGQFQFYSAVQVPKKRWLAFPSQENPRQWHLEAMDTYANGIPMDEPFVMSTGNSLMYPGDIAAPGEETINCHCDLVPMNEAGKTPDITRKDFFAWENELLTDGAGKAYIGALADFFQREKKRYLDHLATVTEQEV